MVATPFGSSPSEHAWLDPLEEAVISFRRGTQHRFMQTSWGLRALRIEAGGRPAGYAYVSAEGHVGPLLAAPEADEAAVVLAAIREGLAGRSKQISLVVPGRAERILAALSPLGFRIEESTLMMAARSFGDWTRYLPSSPGIL
jgi:hypothetical protein